MAAPHVVAPAARTLGAAGLQPKTNKLAYPPLKPSRMQCAPAAHTKPSHPQSRRAELLAQGAVATPWGRCAGQPGDPLNKECTLHAAVATHTTATQPAPLPPHSCFCVHVFLRLMRHQARHHARLELFIHNACKPAACGYRVAGLGVLPPGFRAQTEIRALPHAPLLLHKRFSPPAPLHTQTCPAVPCVGALMPPRPPPPCAPVITKSSAQAM